MTTRTELTPHEARQELLSIPDEAVMSLQPSELASFEHALKIEDVLSSPLAFCQHVTPGFDDWPHIKLLNRWLLALEHGRMYWDGPGPEPVPLTRRGRLYQKAPKSVKVLVVGERPGGTGRYSQSVGVCVDEDGLDILVHPTRGDRPVYNLAIDMPPRHGKSYLVSQHHPAYFLAKYPNLKVILASYEADFAASWGGKARDKLLEFAEGGVTVRGGTNSSRSWWYVDGYTGEMRTAGAGGVITGTGAHWIVCDDLVKNQEDAMSQTQRQSKIDWWHSTLYTRREPWPDGTPGRVVLMATRWHEEDPTGILVPEDNGPGSTWAHLHLPALCDDPETDPLGRREGQALCPQRKPARDLRDEQVADPLWFSALYQGNPFLSEGNLIKRPFHLCQVKDGHYLIDGEMVPEGGFRFLSVDLAGTTRRRSDRTAMVVCDVLDTTPRKFVVRSARTMKIDTEAHEEEVVNYAREWNCKFIGIEAKTFGINLVNRLIARGGVSVRPFPANDSKELRAFPLANGIRNKVIWFAEGDYLGSLEDELVKFPNGKYDDQLDALAHAFLFYMGLPRRRIKDAEPHTPEERAAASIKAAKLNHQRSHRNHPTAGRLR